MPARVTASYALASRAPDTAATPVPPHVAAVEAARRELGLSYDEIGAAVGANASTLHRWRGGATAPPPAYRRRAPALAALTAAARGSVDRDAIREAAAAAAARAGLDGAGPAWPGHEGEHSGSVLALGQVARLAALLTAVVAATTGNEAATLASPAPPPSRPCAGRGA
jgi:hypothetical protein